MFTGFCQEKKYKKELDYYCKNQNTPCCGLCLSKIKTRENGKHHDLKQRKIYLIVLKIKKIN